MEQYIILICIGIFGYLLGSLNFSLIVGKLYNVDVRKHGSGSAGMTNTLRTLGKLPAILVTLGDALKAVIACIVGSLIVGELGESNVGLMIGGICAVLGHNWPIFFKFKGGKGVLTSITLILMMSWKIGLILMVIFVIIVAITRYVSLGSIVCAVLFPIIAFVFKDYFQTDNVFIIFASFAGILVIVRHRGNITRLLDGVENKLGAKKKTDKVA